MKTENKYIIGLVLYVIGALFGFGLIWWKWICLILIQGTGVVFLMYSSNEINNKDVE